MSNWWEFVPIELLAVLDQQSLLNKLRPVSRFVSSLRLLAMIFLRLSDFQSFWIKGFNIGELFI